MLVILVFQMKILTPRDVKWYFQYYMACELQCWYLNPGRTQVDTVLRFMGCVDSLKLHHNPVRLELLLASLYRWGH